MTLEQLPAAIERMKAHAVSPAVAEKWRWDNEVVPHLKATGLPPMFWERRINWNCPPQEKVYNLVKARLQGKGAIIALVGPWGTGKTEIAAQLIIDRANTELSIPWHRRPPYRKLGDLITRFKPLYADYGSINTEMRTLYRDDFCRSHPFIVIDEIRDVQDQKMRQRILTDLLDRRYSHRTDTLLIDNSTPADFKEYVGGAVVSRLNQFGAIIPCSWKSFRER